MKLDAAVLPRTAALAERLAELHDVASAAGLLAWDRETNMPPGGSEARIAQMATMSRLVHRMTTDDALYALLDDAAAEVAGRAPDDPAAALVRVTRRHVDDARCLPEDFVRRRAEISGRAHPAWVQARADDDFGAFAPHLAAVVELGRELAGYYGYADDPYDALLDRFEEGATTAQVRALFDELQAALVPIARAIREEGRPIDDGILHRDYPVPAQQAYARELARSVGYDLDRGHIGTAVHPFAASFGRGDCRITTRWYPNFVGAAIFGTLHECGHAMYEQGTDPAFARGPLARGASSGLHESQSRTMENLVGRSRGFWEARFGNLQAAFPSALGDADADGFYRAVNKVQGSPIRVEADELTYNLHIVLRFELEQALLRGDLAVADLPAAWNERMVALLGIAPPSDREGVLQDVHWTRPSFGYFPTYALGNLIAAQLFQAAVAADPAVASDLAAGSPAALWSWLGEHVHRHGKVYRPADLVVRATGRPLGVESFVRYARAKFGDVYDLAL